MPPSVFWVAQLVERQTVIATRLLSEGPWFEPMSRSFCFLVRPEWSIGMVDLGEEHLYRHYTRSVYHKKEE